MTRARRRLDARDARVEREGKRTRAFDRLMCLSTRARQMIHGGPWGPSGTIVHVNVEHEDRKSDVKRRISHATGIPVTDVKVILASPTQIAAGSKRCPGLSYGNCGVMEKLGLAVLQAETGDKPFVPRLSPNRIDNKGNWTKVE